MILISITHTLICLEMVIFLICMLRFRFRSILLFVCLSFIIFDSFGLAIAPFIPLTSALPYMKHSFFLINLKNEELYFRQILSHWIFLGLSMIGIILEIIINKATEKAKETIYISIKNVILICLLIGFGIYSYYRYFIQGPGFYILATTKLSFSTTSEAIASRLFARSLVRLGQGAYLASLTSKIILPLLSSLAVIFRFKKRYLIIVTCFLLSLVYALQTRQKAPILVAILMYLAIIIIDMAKKYINDKSLFKIFYSNNKIIVKSVITIVLIGIIVSTALYSINFGLPLFASLLSSFSRIFFLPAATETNYFKVFPEIINFRGIDKIFAIFITESPFDITIYDVAIAATGDKFTSNASFIAVGWSGAGYQGVIVISLILIIGLLLTDFLLIKQSYLTYLLGIILSIPPSFMLISGSLFDYINSGGIVLPILISIFEYTAVKTRGFHHANSILCSSKYGQ